MENKKKVLWLGVTPLEQYSDRTYSLVDKLGSIHIDYPNTTIGMETYDNWSKYLQDWSVIATDQENIDESWENFFAAENWGKQIIQFKDNEWTELKPGFSKNYQK